VRGAVGAFLDISARKAAEAALRASQARLGGMIDTAMDAIVSVNQEQRIVVFNAAAESMFGQSAAAALGQPLDQFIPASAHAAHRRAIPAFGATGVTSRSMHRLQPLRALRADGREFPIEATVSQIGSGDEKLYTAIIRDVTERQCADEERAQILQREQAARAIAEDAVQLREVFLSIAAHELKTPLTALLGFAHVLDRRLAQNTSLGERERRAMGGIVEQGDRLRRLIETLLDLTRIQHGSLEMDLRPVDLTALCQRVAAQVRAGLDSHTLHVQIGPEAYVVAGDELRLEQVLQNLLQNAVKYSPEGGPILLRLQRMGDTVQLAVSDQGIGIPEDAQHRLFSQFFRASNVDPRRISGLGLGLYLVNEIVMAHGGTTDVASREGFGSTFSVHLPALGAQVPAAESSAA
jgi:PAS domain S-box-containing protein